MKIKVNGKKNLVTKSINNYLLEKLNKIEKYFESKDICVYVNMSVKSGENSIEISIPTKLFTIRAEDSSYDLYKSIDNVINKLEKQITKNKSKLQKKYSSNSNFEILTEFESEEELELNIVKRKNLNSKPMDEEEAILQMSLVNHDFFVFKNIEEECVSVIYIRKDKKYGIINIK